jgi:predicted transposase YbfD/YdcC
MDAPGIEDLARRLEGFADRRGPNRLHPLVSVLTIAVLAVLSNCDSWAAIARFAQVELPWLKLFLPLPHGAPSRQTFQRVLALLRPEALEEHLRRWFAQMHQALPGASGQVAIDGKALRRSYQHAWDQSDVTYLVSAFASESGLVLAQEPTAGKGGELEGIRRLLEVLDLEGRTVTIDALGCQRDLAAKIVAAGGDYCLAVKENQPTLHQHVQALLDAQAQQSSGTEYRWETGHGRIETRTAWVSDRLEALGELAQDWPGLAAIALVESHRGIKGPRLEQTTSSTRRYYILSRRVSPLEVQALVRTHWGIENRLHHVLDVTYGEDESRIQKATAANFARLRRLSLNMLRCEKQVKDSIAGKRQRCAFSREYRLQVIAASLAKAT